MGTLSSQEYKSQRRFETSKVPPLSLFSILTAMSTIAQNLRKEVGPAPLQKCVGDFCLYAVNQRGRERTKGAPDIAPKSLLLKRAKMVLCPFHRIHREICSQNRPLSEMKFLDDFWGPLSLPAPFV